METIEWLDEPPASERFSTLSAAMREWVPKLKEHPGKWTVVFEMDKSEAYSKGAVGTIRGVLKREDGFDVKQRLDRETGIIKYWASYNG